MYKNHVIRPDVVNVICGDTHTAHTNTDAVAPSQPEPKPESLWGKLRDGVKKAWGFLKKELGFIVSLIGVVSAIIGVANSRGNSKRNRPAPKDGNLGYAHA